MDDGFESQIATLDQRLAETEKHAKSLLARVRAMRTKTNVGEFAQIAGLFEPVPRQIEQLEASVQAARDAFTYDSSQALADGSYLAELRAEATARDLVLTERDGRLTAFPLLLKLDAKAGGIRIGRRLERRLRPAVVVRLLRKAQATSRFDATRFLQQLFDAYAYLAPAAQSGWRVDHHGTGPVVTLNDIHALLTVLPAAAADYPREEFACDLLRLDRAPDTLTSTGHRFGLPASTGSKGRNRLTVYDETGAERVFVGVQFSRGNAGANHS